WSVTHGTGWCGPLPVICRKMRGSSGAGTDGCGAARRRRSSNGQAEWTFRRGSPRGWMSAILGEEGDFSAAWWQEDSLAADVAVLFARVPVERRHPRAQPAWGHRERRGIEVHPWGSGGRRQWYLVAHQMSLGEEIFPKKYCTSS